jgi:hypothetical protein
MDEGIEYRIDIGIEAETEEEKDTRKDAGMRQSTAKGPEERIGPEINQDRKSVV